MIENVTFNNKILAVIIRANYKSEGIEFFTPSSFSQQLAYMNRPANYSIKPHVHNKVTRNVDFTCEVLIIKSGKVRVDLYSESKKYLKSKILIAGDVILLASGGHGFQMLEESEIIEVKQGPYVGERDKTRFEAVREEKVSLID